MHKVRKLENCLVARYFPLAYYLAMENKSFKDRTIEAMKASDTSKAELSRRSGVPYHTLDKFLKRDAATTGAENAAAIAKALGIKVDDDSTFDELRQVYGQLTKEKQEMLLKMAQSIVAE